MKRDGCLSADAVAGRGDLLHVFIIYSEFL